MAKRRRRTYSSGGGSRSITRVVRAPAPIIRVSAPRAHPARRRRGRSRGHRSPSGLVSNESFQIAIGGAIYGFAVKQGIIAKLPEIPLLGRTGTAAILLDYWARHGGGSIVHRAARAAAAIAGYQLGAEGKISGDDSFSTAGFTTTGDFAMGSEGADPASDSY